MGISFEQPSQLLVQHYQKNTRYTRDMALESYIEILKKSAQQFNSVSVEAGGAFAFRFADFLFNGNRQITPCLPIFRKPPYNSFEQYQCSMSVQ